MGFGREGSRGQKRAEKAGGGGRGWEEKGKKDWGEGGGDRKEKRWDAMKE
jgi:hypothetical protein